MSATRGDLAPARPAFLLGAELGLLALALGTAVGLVRLFDGAEFLGRLLVPLVAAWALPLALRRVGVRLGASAGLQLVVGALVLAWWFAWDTTAAGVPTGGTVTALRESVQGSFGRFGELVAPVPVEDGFLVPILAALWVFATFADAAAFRYRAPVQAAVPYLAAFVAVGVLAREQGRTAAAVAFVVGLGCYAVGQRALSGLDERWIRGRDRLGARALAGTAAVLVAVAAVVGVVAGPRLPGGTEAVVDLRDLGRGDGPRTVVSPFVGIRSLLGERSDEVMFRVEADEPAYWRLTSLEEYDPDREIWVSRGTYRRVDADLPASIDAGVPTRPLEQRYRVEALSGVWLPAAYVPARVEADAELSYAERSASLILRDDRTADGLRYALTSRLPDFAALDRARSGPDPDLEDQYLEVPPLAPEVQDAIAAAVPAGGSDVSRLVALQTWFRETFDYDEAVDYSGEPDAVAAFLAARRGFCQQFASTFALAARYLGMPARVAVGFTPGEAEAAEAGGRTTFVVRGRYAHAWPEVHFRGVGWVPFEPTPQRGNPQAERHTGVPAQQASGPLPEQTTTTVTTTTTAPEDPATPTSAPAELRTTDAPRPPEPADRSGPGVRVWLLVAAALGAVVTLGLVVLARRRRSGRHPEDDAQRRQAVADAWRDTLRALALVGVVGRPDETPVELARRAGPLVGVDLAGLADLETRRRYAGRPLGAEDVAAARAVADRVEELVRERTTRRQRVAALVSR